MSIDLDEDKMNDRFSISWVLDCCVRLQDLARKAEYNLLQFHFAWEATLCVL